MHLLGTYFDGEYLGHPNYFSEYQGPFPYLFLTPKRGTSLSDAVSGRTYGLLVITGFAECDSLVSWEDSIEPIPRSIELGYSTEIITV